MHGYYFYLPVMNLGASVMIASVSVTISKVAAHHQGPHQYHSQRSIPMDPWQSSAS